MENEAYIIQNQIKTGPTVVIDPELCTGCNSCTNVCRQHIILPSPEKNKPPILLNREECWYCGCCALYCPVPGAIKVIHPLVQRVGWKRKETGEYFRVGMKNPPPPNTRPPVDWSGPKDITGFSSGRDATSIYK
jgi:NAD-dependent dihydropyrimidine dehydrogenase PreA subunit